MFTSNSQSVCWFKAGKTESVYSPLSKSKKKRCLENESVAGEHRKRPKQEVHLNQTTQEKMINILSSFASEVAQLKENPSLRVDSGPSFTSLPDEIKLHIFGFLSPIEVLNRVPLVCREWKNLALDEGLWHLMFCTHFGGSPYLLTDNHDQHSSSPDRLHNCICSPKLGTEFDHGWRIQCCSLLQHLKELRIASRHRMDKEREKHKIVIEKEMLQFRQELLQFVVETGCVQLLRGLLRGPLLRSLKNFKIESKTMLLACKKGNVEVMKELVASGLVDLEEALSMAVMMRDLKAAKFIIMFSLSFKDLKDSTKALLSALFLASVNRDKNMIDLVINLVAVQPQEMKDQLSHFANFLVFDGPIDFSEDCQEESATSDEEEEGEND